MKRLGIAALAACLMVCACAKKDETADPGTVSTAPDAGKTSPTKATPSTDAGTNGTTAAGPTQEALAGTWKVDLAATSVPDMSESDKKEEGDMRVELKPDGTYTMTGIKDGDSGKWALTGKSVNLTSDKGKHPPSPLEASDDGSKLTISHSEGGKSMTIVFVKG